ncbi:hypothetical protein G5B41_17610 [bacterium SGD-2]|nr:hypothetical protein [bacterium SGD-2]
MEHKHTPGPWQIGIADWDENDDARYSLAGNKEVHIGDARLIAAAPDLLEALHEAAECIGDRSAGSSRFWDLYDAAIAKATGSQP